MTVKELRTESYESKIYHLGGNTEGARIMATLCLVILFFASFSTNFLINDKMANRVNLFSTGKSSTSKFSTFSHSGKSEKNRSQ